MLLLEPALASAQTFPAFTQTDTYSNSGWGVNTTRGWSFTVSSRIVVEQLGLWDLEQNGLASAHGVGLWRGDGTLLTSATVPAGTGATLDGTFHWVATTQVELQPGNTYVVGAYWTQYNPDNALGLGENVVFDSRVSLVQGRAINTLGLTYPAAQDGLAAELSANFRAHVAPNQPPVADAGPDQSVYTGEMTLLHGAATDADGDAIIFWGWIVDAWPAGADFNIYNDDSPTARFQPLSSGDYVLELAVVDANYNASVPDCVTIQAANNVPPVRW